MPRHGDARGVGSCGDLADELAHLGAVGIVRGDWEDTSKQSADGKADGCADGCPWVAWLTATEFEKDDDSNGHMDFITAARYAQFMPPTANMFRLTRGT